MSDYPKTLRLMARGCEFLGTDYAILCGAKGGCKCALNNPGQP